MPLLPSWGPGMVRPTAMDMMPLVLQLIRIWVGSAPAQAQPAQADVHFATGFCNADTLPRYAPQRIKVPWLLLEALP